MTDTLQVLWYVIRAKLAGAWVVQYRGSLSRFEIAFHRFMGIEVVRLNG